MANSSSHPMGAPAPGDMMGVYRVERLLGRGGTGAVFLAYDTKLHRQVALKTIDGADSELMRARLLREARSAAALNHPNICTIHDVDERHAFIAMEYVNGRSLADRLREGSLPFAEALRYGIDASEALAYAHERSVVHRDFKAANIIVSREGRVKIVDFGLARRSDAALSGATTMATMEETGQIAGTPYAMAPEQVRAEPALASADIWAMGVLLYEMVEGRQPFEGATAAELFSAILRDAPRPLAAQAPAALRTIISRCLEKDPTARYSSAHEIADALRDIPPSAAETRREGAARPRRRKAIVTGVAIALVALALAGTERLRSGLAGPRPSIQSIAVLPIANVTGDAAQDYFADGMHELLIGDLSTVGALKVLSRGAVMPYARTHRTAREIGAALHVDSVVDGSIARTGDGLRVTMRLVHAATDTPIWSNSYERDIRDALALQNEIARAVVTALKTTITSTEAARLSAHTAVSPEALDLYLRGRLLLRPGGPPDAPRRALELFEAAAVRAPTFALAQAGIAEAYVFLGNGGFRGLQGDGADAAAPSFARAEEAARHALELDPSVAEAHVSLGIVRFTHYDWAGGMEECRGALELNPNLADARFWLANALSILGRREEAIVQARKAEEVDPLNEILGWILYRSRRYPEAIEELRRLLSAGGPNGARVTLGRLYLRTQRYQDAVEQYEQSGAIKAMPDAASDMRREFKIGGGRSLIRWLAEFFQRQTFRPMPPGNLAWYYAMAGETDHAFEMLERGYAENSLPGAWSLEDPGWDSIRTHPRFRELLRLMNLPESLVRVPDSNKQAQ